MQIDVENINATERKVSIEVPWADVKVELDDAYRQLSKRAKVRGFRAGKVPRKVLEKFYKSAVEGEVLQRLVDESFKKAIVRNPAVGWPRRWLVATYGQLGKLDDAEWEISELDGLGQPLTINGMRKVAPVEDPEVWFLLTEGMRKAGVPEE